MMCRSSYQLHQNPVAQMDGSTDQPVHLNAEFADQACA
jgi:hypothetical protein